MANNCFCIKLPIAGLVIGILSLTISFILTFYLIVVTIDPKSDASWKYLKTRKGEHNAAKTDVSVFYVNMFIWLYVFSDTILFIEMMIPLILSNVVSFLLLLGIILVSIISIINQQFTNKNLYLLNRNVPICCCPG